MKFIITGKRGFLSEFLQKKCENSGQEYIALTSDKNASSVFDLNCPSLFDYNSVSPGDFILHTAAISSPDYCNKHYDEAYRINVKGTIEFIQTCLEKGAGVIFFSSDTVYGPSADKNDVFDENSICNPAGEYGYMKYEVEKYFFNEPNFKSVRLSYVFSKSDKFTKYIVESIKEDIECEIFHPFYRNAVYVNDVTDTVFSLVKKWNGYKHKFLNICGPDLLSRKDIAELINKYYNGKMKYKVVTPPDDFFISRPKIINTRSIFVQEIIDSPLRSLKNIAETEFKN